MARQNRLVVFVDDLDRCLPERTVEVLEAIKLFLDVPGCIFVLGVDPAKVQEGVRLRYKTALAPAESAHYLEKIIQVPFILPDIDVQDMRGFVEQLQVDFPPPQPQCVDVFALGLDPNPRQIKRAINIFLLLWKLAGKRRLKVGADANPTDGPLLSEVLTPVRLAKLVVIQHSHPDLYDLLKLSPRYLRDLEIYFVDQRDEPGAEEAEESGSPVSETPPKAALPGPLEPFAQRAGLRRLFRLFPNDNHACFRFLTPTDLRLYLTLAGRVETEPHRATVSPRRAPRLGFEPELIQIPEGKFVMGTPPEEAEQLGEFILRSTPQHTVEMPAYEIGRYPVTNLEYQAFVDATGRETPSHWEKGQFSDELADHPVTNVSWRDATAYCTWLAETTGKPYRLPTEAEWERAARGTDGHRYPWGDEWQENRANTKEAGLGITTPVGQYSPDGDSPAGCADMAGNVWEWTASDFKAYPGSHYQDEDYGKRLKVLRGGSCNNDKAAARTASRFRLNFRIWNWSIGFRVAVGVAPSLGRM
ncbi:MAG: SUMF1/EgtB/PvdO family nonheme iron enzyme [Anaerolineae bacterium]|nr:SUMF1/EgtB/PvdO family nonheme iron enzyme [Anaerolineae bacterium]